MQHASGGMVIVLTRKLCRIESCGERPPFAVAGTKTAEYCPQHSSFDVDGTRNAEYCAQHTRMKCDAEGCKGKEIGLHHYGKETNRNESPSCAKQKTVHSFPALAISPSGGSRVSRKREQPPEITSTALKRAVSRGSAGEAAAMPEIEEQKSSVRRNSSVKTEVQLSL